MKNKAQNTPPSWPLRLLKTFIHPDYLEEIEGDLEELYQENLDRHSKLRSQWKYGVEVIKLLRPLLSRRLEGTYRLNNYGIIKNYIKVAGRNFRKNKLQFSIKALGLTIALATSIIIFQYIAFEKSYDQFHSNLNELYRVDVDRIHGGVIQSQKATSYSAFGPDAIQEIPGIEEFARIRIRSSSIVIQNDSTLNTYPIQKPAFVDPSFLELFDFGIKSTQLFEDPNSILLTAKTSKKYFGDVNPVGKIITFIHGRHELPLEIKAIIPDVPSNSHIQFEALIPYQTIFPQGDWVSHSWDWSGVTTYFKLKTGTEPTEIESYFPGLVRKYKGEKMKERDRDYKFYLRPVKDIHLTSHLDGELEANGNEESLYFLGIAGILILTITWLNHMNLTTAQNTTRRKEMSVRKVLGAHKIQIFTQLFIESLLVHGIAVLFAAILITTCGNSIKAWMDISFHLDILMKWEFWTICLLYSIVGSALVSFDYRLVFRSFNNKQLTNTNRDKSYLSFRKIGVTFQFGILVGLIVITWAVNSQLTFIQNFNLGLNKDHVIVIEKPRLSRADRQNSSVSALQDKIQNLPFVTAMSSSFQVPGSELGWSGGMRRTTQPKDYGQDMYVTSVSENYIKTLGLNLIAGSSFEQLSCEEHRHVILNRSASELLGYDSPQEAIHTDIINSTDRKHRVIGVIEDFHYNSLHESIEPLILNHIPRPLDFVFVSLRGGNILEQIEGLENTWQEVYHHTPFDFFFLDEHINQQYQTETEFKKLFSLFSSIATILALMGIIGLSSFYTARRIKEIGIRKVLGANYSSIIWLLSSHFISLISIGALVAMPFSYYIIKLWLESFFYQVEITWIWFVTSFAMVIAVSWLVLSIQTFNATRVNPTECLKDE